MVSPDDLTCSPLFAELDSNELRELANWFHVQNSSEGVKLVGEGAPGYTFFVLADGTAEVTSEGTTLATLGSGDYFGEIAILGEGRRTATVTSTSPVKLLVIFGTEFRQLEALHPAISSHLTDAMKSRLAGIVTEAA